jgi:hypothetical protein
MLDLDLGASFVFEGTAKGILVMLAGFGHLARFLFV